MIIVDDSGVKGEESKKPDGVEGKGVFSGIYRLKNRELNEDDDGEKKICILVHSYGREQYKKQTENRSEK